MEKKKEMPGKMEDKSYKKKKRSEKFMKININKIFQRN
jgi:hypothetical protein